MKKNLRFYRGIAVPADKVTSTEQEIKSQGLSWLEGLCRYCFRSLKPSLHALWENPQLSRKDIDAFDEIPSLVAACADRDSALQYACHRNRSRTKDTPMLITFEAPIEHVIIDGRDFLYPIFQRGVPLEKRPPVIEAFGNSINHYLERGWLTQD